MRRATNIAAMVGLLFIAGAARGEGRSSTARSLHRYEIPEVTVIDQDGRRQSLEQLLAGDTPVAVNFVYTTCNTICPVMSATFQDALNKLGPDAARVRMVSVSIDPAHDRPEVLKAYAGRFGAPEGWKLVTGSPTDITRVLQAFGVFRGDKANHVPVTLLRPAKSAEWVRLDGLLSGRELAEQVHALLSKP